MKKCNNKVFIKCFLAISLLCAGCAPRGPKPLSPEQAMERENKMQSLLRYTVTQLRDGSASALDRAYSALELARELDDNDPRVFDGLGSVEWRRGSEKLAEYYFRRAIEINSTYSRPYAHLALVAEKRGDYQAARDLLSMAIKLNPLNYRARNNYAAQLVRHATKPDDEQTAYYELLKVARGAAKDDPVLNYNLGRFE